MPHISEIMQYLSFYKDYHSAFNKEGSPSSKGTKLQLRRMNEARELVGSVRMRDPAVPGPGNLLRAEFNTPITHTEAVAVKRRRVIGLTLVIISLRICTANHVLFQYMPWLFFKIQ